MTKPRILKEFEAVQGLTGRAIAPIKPSDNNTKTEQDFWMKAARTNAGRKLPPYYLVYFLLVDLLDFPSHGRSEKVAWSVPIDFDGAAYVIEHRKFGLGVFAPEGEEVETQARKIVGLIHSGVRAARPFLKWVADNAVKNSQLNVTNKSARLFERFSFFQENFRLTSSDAQKRRDERKEERRTGVSRTVIQFPAYKIARNASWLALAAIDTFFSWTEHIFIHLAILQSLVTTGEDVAKLAESDWSVKFKAALDINNKDTKKHFDELVNLRRQLRNFIAHGAFGKRGEAFTFHSGAGAVPVVLDQRPGMPRFSLSPELAFDDSEALAAIEKFIDHLWSGKLAPAKIYLQDSELPLILPMASDGTYAKAMETVTEMAEFVEYLSGVHDRATDMDW